MIKRLVVCMRWRPGGEGQEAQSFASVAEAALERMAALGGRLILWHPEWLAVDFSLEALQDAIDFIVDSPPRGVGSGFAYGPLTEMLDGGPMLAACSGPTVDRAVSLARMARAGEVLVEPALVKASGGELLVKGGRVATIGSSKLRGLKLDLSHPQRSLECESVARLSPAPWCGRMPSLLLCAGQLSLVIAARGGGGSRFLAEHRSRHHPGALTLSRLASGYPQAALAQALGDQEDSGKGQLSQQSEAALAALHGGKGVETDRAAALLAEWIERHDLPRVVYLCDAAEIDADSLEAVARVAAKHDLAVIAGADKEAPLPPPLAELKVAGRAMIPALESNDAIALLRYMAGDQLSLEQAERLARRGMPYPLGVTQSLVEALDSASYLWADGGVVPRVARDEAPELQSAESLLRRRLHLVELNDRLLIEALAVLGGRAHTTGIVALLRLAGRAVTNAEASLAYLERVGWLSSSPGELVSLATRTQRAVVVSLLSDRRFTLLHQAAATLRAESGKPLALASAALHAGLAGNRGKASLLAKRAAQSARNAGLEPTALALERYADSGDIAALIGRQLAGSWADEHHHTQASQDEQFLDASFAADQNSAGQTSGARTALKPGRRDSNPSRAPDAPSAVPAQPAPPIAPEPRQPDADVERVSETDLEAMSADDMVLAPASEEPEGDITAATELGAAAQRFNGGQESAPTMRVAGVPSDSESLMPERAAIALGRGDPVTLDELARQLRGEAHSVLADRLDAMAQLVRGNVGDALRLLREAKERANQAGPSERCRASLALSVAIAAAGRPSDALLEVLEGLASARRAGDVRGERACAKFTAQLAERAGQPSVAAAWQAASARVSE